MTETPIRKPGEELVRSIRSSIMSVEIYETYVVKRPHRHARTGTEGLAAMPRVIEAHQAAAADGVPGVLRCELEPEGGVVEERAPGVALDMLDPPLTPEEIVYVYHETTHTTKALHEYGIYLRRANPQNTWLERETGRVTQIDLHHPNDFDPENHSDEALRDNLVSMLARGVAWARIAAEGGPSLEDIVSEASEAYSRVRDVYDRMEEIRSWHGHLMAQYLQPEMDEEYRKAGPIIQRLSTEKQRRELVAKQLEPSVRALLEQDAKGEPLRWEEPEENLVLRNMRGDEDAREQIVAQFHESLQALKEEQDA